MCLGCNYGRGMLLWGSPFVLCGVFSGHMGSMRVMVTGLSGFPSSFCNKEVVTAKIPLPTTHLLFSKVPFTESSGELCYFWAGSISAWHQSGNRAKYFIQVVPSCLSLPFRGSRFVSSKEKGERLILLSLVVLFFVFTILLLLHGGRGKRKGKSQRNSELGCLLCISNWWL